MSDRLYVETLPPPDLGSIEDVCACLEDELPDTILCVAELANAGIGKRFVQGSA
jgi:hypothetical protein